jgi:hypothetical protein
MLNRELVAQAIGNLPAQVSDIGSPEQFIDAWTLLEFIQDRAKAMKAALEESGISYMQHAGIREVVIGAEAKIILTEKKKECYDTDGIYKALAFTPEQVSVLPKNPSWRKTAIQENEKTAPFWSQDVFPDLEVKRINPVMIDKIMAAKKPGGR